ncbi:MAG: hypothetical protein ABI925_05680 [Verrucomicrobiota bacterium]
MEKSRTPLTIGWEAARANAVPGFILQGAMLAILIAYYANARFANLLNLLAHYKEKHGLVFILAAGILAGALLPELFLIFFFQKGKLNRQNLRNLAFTVPTWAIDAVLVDLMYRANAMWFGSVVTVPVVFAKICVDQLGYNPFLAAPGEVLVYEWKNDGFSWASVKRAFTWDHYRDKIVPTLLATWVVWGPLMAIIYSLPYPLQFPLFSLALTFWVLLLTYMTNRFAGKIEADAPLALATAEKRSHG